ncbi:hypothetical protein [Bosea sp. 685]|uniref:hypothetical protein n=1 Tax=Bosea sp. 685 TaxID=3080057 RepID=UPI0028931AE5|nr:hypothetical protein [Bosea sp. 685]WNJ88936.1 hypothetical protein RMR04_21310 [Bosea sp. 685]
MIQLRNAALWATTIGATVGIPLVMLAIIGYILPLSASEALSKPPKGAHEFGFWLLLLLSLPFWLAASWLSALATVNERQDRGGRRRAIWALALLFSALAMAAINNILGFGDLFSLV